MFGWAPGAVGCDANGCAPEAGGDIGTSLVIVGCGAYGVFTGCASGPIGGGGGVADEPNEVLGIWTFDTSESIEVLGVGGWGMGAADVGGALKLTVTSRDSSDEDVLFCGSVGGVGFTLFFGSIQHFQDYLYINYT